MPSPPPPSFNISFQNEVTIYQQNVICHVKENEFNLSYNPTLLKNNLQSGSNFMSQSLSTPLPEVKDFATASYFEPYVTTIGLYNEDNTLLAVAKLSKPLLKSFQREALIRVKLDF